MADRDDGRGLGWLLGLFFGMLLAVAVGAIAFVIFASLARGDLFDDPEPPSLPTVTRLDLPLPTATVEATATIEPTATPTTPATATAPPSAPTSATPLTTSGLPAGLVAAAADLCGDPDLRRAESVTAILDEARAIHQWWADYLREAPLSESTAMGDQVGDISWQLQWVRNYDRAIALSRGYVDGCGRLRQEIALAGS